MRPLVGVDRKGSQISALSVDKQYVQQRMAANLESRSEHERRELPVENHWLAIMFQPIPCPQMFVPDYLKDRLPQAPIQKVMPALSIETTIVWSPRKSIPAKREASSGQSSPARSVGKAANVEHLADLLEKDELDLVMRVCSLFNELVARRVADNGMEILTRGAFCRMICVMGGLAVNGGRTMLMKAVARYDKLAASHSVKERGAAKGSRGTVTGLQISCSGGQLPHDLPVGTLFAQLLQDIADSFLLQMETSSRTRSESTLSRSESILRLEDSLYVFAMQSAKNLLFNGLLRDAEDFAKQRLEWIKQQIQKLMPEPEALYLEMPTMSGQDPSLPAPSVATSRRTSLAQSVRPPSKASSMNRQSIRLPVSPWTPPSERAMSSTERAVSVYSDWSEKDKDTAQVKAKKESMYRGEVLASILFEPEVMQLTAEIAPLLRTIFCAYRDVPTPSGAGHMTLSAFLRFCKEFALFPKILDFETVHWLYTAVEGRPEVKVNTNVTGIMIPAADNPKPELEPKKSGKSPKAKQRPRKKSEDCGKLVGGKWLTDNLSWLAKPYKDMNQEELRSMALLTAMNSWMQSQRFQVRQLLAFLDEDCSGAISVSELTKGVEVMAFENPPSRSDVLSLANMLATKKVLPPPVVVEPSAAGTAPADAAAFAQIARTTAAAAAAAPVSPSDAASAATNAQNNVFELSFHTLEIALAVVSEREEQYKKANVFTKDFYKMNRAESNASIFLGELGYALECRRLTPQQFFSIFDEKNTGKMRLDELTQQSRLMIKTLPVISLALMLERPLEIFGLNDDNELSCKRFCDMVQRVMDAKGAKDKAKAENHPLFLCASYQPDATPGLRRIFGFEAFAEVLVKIALCHLGFQCTEPQCEMSSFHQLLWLVMYLNWSFRKACEEEATLVQEEGQRGKTVFEEAAGQFLASYISPMRRLYTRSPNLFASVNSTLQDISIPMPSWASPGEFPDVMLSNCIKQGVVSFRAPTGQTSVSAALWSVVTSV